jgi:uncharacterized peroxidase-related enzyme
MPRVSPQRSSSVLERELIAAYVAGFNHCRYCYGVHTATAERLGAPAGLVSRLVESPQLNEAPETMRPVLRYAQKLTHDVASITRSDAEAILAAGWSETAIYRAVAITALSNFMNGLVEGLGIELDLAYAKAAAERLADRGYQPLIEMLRGQ